MVEFPPYVRLIVDNDPRRGSAATRSVQRRSLIESERVERMMERDGAVYPNKGTGDVVDLVSLENRRAAQGHVPSPSEAEEALKKLSQDLPGMGPAVGDIHSKLDRRIILSLLAPLVTG